MSRVKQREIKRSQQGVNHNPLQSDKRADGWLNRIQQLAAIVMLITSVGCGAMPWPGRFSFGQETEIKEMQVAPNHCRVTYDPSFIANYPSRVVLVASGKNVGNYQTNNRLISELASAFRAAGLFEVVDPPDVLLSGHGDNILKGKFVEREIAKVTREFNADCVAIVKVNELRSHSPLRTSITIAFVDRNESVTYCGLDGVWDLGIPATMQSFENFCANNGEHVHNGLHQKSPRALFDFVAYESANAMMAIRN